MRSFKMQQFLYRKSELLKDKQKTGFLGATIKLAVSNSNKTGGLRTTKTDNLSKKIKTDSLRATL
jgi:hypothetical protein